MYQLSHQVNNKPLFIALGVAVILHFLFTLTYQIDSEWTTPKPRFLPVILVQPDTSIAAVEPTLINPTPIKPVLEKPAPIKAEPKPIDKPKLTAKKTEIDYLGREQWGIVKRLSSAETIQKIFVDLPADISQQALSLNLYGIKNSIDFALRSCTNGVKNYVYKDCPADRLNLAILDAGKNIRTVAPLLLIAPSPALRLSLSSPGNPQWLSDIERPFENWTYLAGLPTLNIPIN